MKHPQPRGAEESGPSLRQRLEQLEKELAERDKRLLQTREELAYSKEEARHKTKLVIQLQKQLVELEARRDSGNSKQQSSSSSSFLFGTLLGAASGETHELSRLKQDLVVQGEELLKRIRENEELQVRCFELEQQQDRDKKTMTAVIDKEVRRALRVEKDCARLKEELDVTKIQNEVLRNDLGVMEARLESSKGEMQRLRLDTWSLERLRQREAERFSLTMTRFPVSPYMTFESGSKPWILERGEAECECILDAGDVCYWLSRWCLHARPVTDQAVAAVKALTETVAMIEKTLIHIKDEAGIVFLLNQHVAVLQMTMRTLSNAGEGFAETVISEYDRARAQGNSDLTIGSWRGMLRNIVDAFRQRSRRGLDQTKSFLEHQAVTSLTTLNESVVRLDVVWDKRPASLESENVQLAKLMLDRMGLEKMSSRLDEPADSDDTSLVVPVPAKKVGAKRSPSLAEVSHIDITKQSDESFLNSLEDFLQPKEPPVLSLADTFVPTKEPNGWHSVVDDQASQTNHDVAKTPVTTETLQLKKYYHEHMLKHLGEIAELKNLLRAEERRAADAERRVSEMYRQGQVLQNEQNIEGLSKLREELQETCQSYNAQLLTMTERIMELERDLQLKREEADQLRAEKTVMIQLRKTMKSRTPVE